MKLSLITILLLIILAGCSGFAEDSNVPKYVLEMENVTLFSEEDIAAADTMRFENEQVFGDTDMEPIASFGSIVTDRFGRVFIGDSQQRTIHIFKPDGRYLGRIGRDGDGPGEFRWVSYLNIHDQQLYAYDPNGRKINLFDIGGYSDTLPEFISDIRIGSDSWESFTEPNFVNPSFHSLLSNGDIILSSRTSPLLYRQTPDSIGVTRYYRWNRNDQDQPEAIFQTQQAKHIVTEWFIIPPPFESKEIMTISEDNQIFSAGTEEFLIRRHAPEGDYHSAFYYPSKKDPLTREEAVRSVDQHEQLTDAVQSLELPDSWPVLRQMFTDDENRLWVSANTENTDVYKWWVLQESGELIAKFEWPRDESIAAVKNGKVYTRQTDAETGKQQVVRYGIEI